MPNPCPIRHRAESLGVREFGTVGVAQLFTPEQTLTKSVTSDALTSRAEFGSAYALCQGMMPQLTETLEHTARPQCSIEEARELLEALRAAYQSLGLAERSAVKGFIAQSQPKQRMQEIDEVRECFESLS